VQNMPYQDRYQKANQYREYRDIFHNFQK